MFLLIDNYDSFTFNLYAVFKQLGQEVRVIKNDEFIKADNYKGIILSPGPSNPANSGTTLKYLNEYAGKLPIFGVCLGMQAIGYYLGNRVRNAQTIKHGKVEDVKVIKDEVLYKGVPKSFKAVRYHSLVIDIDESFVTSRSISDNEIMSIEIPEKKLFGVQYHPESFLSEFGDKIIENFVNYCGGKDGNIG
ncbi:aminodeoxychorismate/anthranilate synthase component II [Deferribacteraceae bacterium V6Fe1]|nr:aminodeoxychorismate/anthranilate synthase component II [Deferribacteraceae bacterium V6Fe1]